MASTVCVIASLLLSAESPITSAADSGSQKSRHSADVDRLMRNHVRRLTWEISVVEQLLVQLPLELAQQLADLERRAAPMDRPAITREVRRIYDARQSRLRGWLFDLRKEADSFQERLAAMKHRGNSEKK